VNDELQRAVQHEARRFFALSDEQKQQVAMIHSPFSRLQPRGIGNHPW
jgi:isopenicillin N synthase-like dioxygenase